MKQDAAVTTTSSPLVHETLPGGGIRVTIRGPASSSFWPVIGGVLTAVLAYTATSNTRFSDAHWTSAAAACAVLLYILARPARILSESVTITPALGITLTTTTRPAIALAPEHSTLFIPRDKVLDIYIGEGFNRFSILDYLALSVAIDGEAGGARGAKVQRVFPNLQPRLPVLIEAYNILHHHLFPTTPARNA